MGRTLSQRQYTSMAEAEIASHIFRLDSVLSKRGVIRFARNVHLDDFKDANNVIICSYRANHWGELYQPDVNFTVEYDRELATPFCRNRNPGPTEQAVYRPRAPTAATGA